MIDVVAEVKVADSNQTKALQIVEQIAPALPLEQPEVALDFERGKLLSDPTGQLIYEIRLACEKLCEPRLRGLMLALDMDSISQTVRSCREDLRWNYVGGPPLPQLDEISRLAGDLRNVFLSEVSLGTASDLWNRGTGVRHATERARKSASYQIEALKERLSQTLASQEVSVSILAECTRERRGIHWPDVDICVLGSCQGFEQYFVWLSAHLEGLRREAANLNSIVVAPRLNGCVIAQCATQIYANTAPIPDPEFTGTWGPYCFEELYTSGTCTLFDKALDALLSLHATKELLSDKRLLASESSFIEDCENAAMHALTELQLALGGPERDAVAGASAFLCSMYERVAEQSATDVVRSLMPGASTDEASEVAIHRLSLIQSGLEHQMLPDVKDA